MGESHVCVDEIVQALLPLVDSIPTTASPFTRIRALKTIAKLSAISKDDTITCLVSKSLLTLIERGFGDSPVYQESILFGFRCLKDKIPSSIKDPLLLDWMKKRMRYKQSSSSKKATSTSTTSNTKSLASKKHTSSKSRRLQLNPSIVKTLSTIYKGNGQLSEFLCDQYPKLKLPGDLLVLAEGLSELGVSSEQVLRILTDSFNQAGKDKDQRKEIRSVSSIPYDSSILLPISPIHCYFILYVIIIILYSASLDSVIITKKPVPF